MYEEICTLLSSGGRPTLKRFLQEKAMEATKQKEKKRKKPKPEEQEGMPHHQHYPTHILEAHIIAVWYR
jgi:uroporphyrinogen-III synthase